MRLRLAALVAVVTLLAAGCSYDTSITLPRGPAQSSQVLWSDGTLLASLHAEQDREEVPLSEMAPTLPTAVVAIEDSRYFEHDGVDPRGILRALTRNAAEGEVVEGGSTITQQYVRAVMLGPERTLKRKIREAVLAIQLERKYSKRTILERYLNLVYFGNGAYGVQAAAQSYFGKDAKDLDLAQSATIAGLIRAPEIYNPFKDPDAATHRRNEVLARMRDLGRVPAAEANAAILQPLYLAPAHDDARHAAPHFVEAVRRFVLGNPAFGATVAQRARLLFEGGLRIETTLDPKAQAAAEDAMKKVLVRPDSDPAGALVAMDPRNGHVVAYVGGPDFYGGQPWAKLDLASQGSRQAGSTFKPIVLATALAEGMPLSRTYSAPGQITIRLPGNQPPWKVNNYDGSGSGQLDLTEATVKSVNTVYAQLIMDVGPQPVVDLAAKMGVRSKLGAYPSAALGTNGVTVMDMASVYQTLANDGVNIAPVMVTKVTRKDGTVLWQAQPERQRALPQDTDRTITQVLQQVVERGTGVNARIGRPVAGKTGTGEEWSDAWFCGYTPELVAAVWVGFPDAARTMRPPATRITVTGGSWPAQIWQGFAGAYLATTPASTFPAPEGPTGPTGATGVGPSSTTAGGPGLPRLVGLSVGDATRALVDAGFRVTVREAPSHDYAVGIVSAQNPAPGRAAPPGSIVSITVSTGPPPVVAVPSVLGMLTDDAVAALTKAGLTPDLRVEAEPPPGSPDRAGRVWKQSPSGAAQVDAGTSVTIWVNPS